MAVRVKCNAGCEKCSKGHLVRGTDSFRCKTKGKKHPRIMGKDCADFRCKGPDQYYCKTCGGGKQMKKGTI